MHSGTIYDDHPNKDLRNGVLKQRKLLGRQTELIRYIAYLEDMNMKVPPEIHEAHDVARREYEEFTLYLSRLVESEKEKDH